MRSNVVDTGLKICLIINELNEYKKNIYEALKDDLETRGFTVDIMIHHGSQEIFARLMRANLRRYTHYVVVPYFDAEPNEDTIELINQIPEYKLILLDEDFKPIKHKHYGAIIQDLESDLFQTLKKATNRITRYSRFILIFPTCIQYPYPMAIVDGFSQFCSLYQVDFVIVENIDEVDAIPGDLFLILDDADLVDLVKLCRQRSFHFGKEIGVISYDDNPLKDVLEEGISVVSYDFRRVAKRIVEMIFSGNLKIEKNSFSLIDKQSF